MTALWLVLITVPGWLSGLSAPDLGFDRGRTQNRLRTVAEDVEKNFYDLDLPSLEWRSLVNQARDRIERAKSQGEMFTAILALLNKLQDSHTIFLPPGRAARVEFGFDAMAFGDKIRIYNL